MLPIYKIYLFTLEKFAKKKQIVQIVYKSQVKNWEFFLENYKKSQIAKNVKKNPTIDCFLYKIQNLCDFTQRN